MNFSDNQLLAHMLRESVAQGQAAWLTVISGSMRPFLQVGDEVRVEKALPDQLSPGDVIVVYDGQTLLTHRFYHQTAAGQLITRGDSLIINDPPFPATALIGRVTGRRRHGHLLDLNSAPGQQQHQRHVRWAIREIQWLKRFGPLDSVPSSPQKLLHYLFRLIRR